VRSYLERRAIAEDFCIEPDLLGASFMAEARK